MLDQHLPPVNGIGTHLISGGNLDNEFGINLVGNISGTGNLILAVSDPSNSNGINQLSGSVSGNGLTLSTTGGNITVNDADFISIMANTNGGNLSFADTDGLILNNIATNGGSLSIITNQIANIANNTVVENNLDLNGIISSGSGNTTLTVNSLGNLIQSGGSISGNGLTLTLNTAM